MSAGPEDRCADLARRWLTTCARGSCRWQSEALAFTDEQLADALIGAWGLDQPQGDDNGVTWFDVHAADREMLVDAFTGLRFDLRKSM